MKRFLAGLVSLALVVVSAPPAAWAQFAEAARAASPSGAAASGAASGAVRVDALPALSVSLSAPPSAPALGVLPAASAAPLFRPGFRPVELTVPLRAFPAPAAAANPISVEDPSSAPAAAAANEEIRLSAPALDAAPKAAPSLRVGLSAAVRALGAPDAKPESTLERLFSGAAARAGLGDALPAAAPSDSAAAVPALSAASAPEGVRALGVPEPAGAPRPAASGPRRAAVSVGRIALAAAAAVGLNAAAVAFSPALFAVVPAAAAWAVASGLLLFPAGMYARYRLARRDSPRLFGVKLVLDLALGAYAGALFVAAPGLAATLSSAGLLAPVLPAAGLAAGMASRGAPFLNSVLVWGALGFTPLVVGAAAVGGVAIGPILGMLALPAMTTIAFFLGSLITAAETGRPFTVPGTLQKMRFPSFQWVMTGVVFALLTGYSAVHANLAFLVWHLLGSRVPAKWDASAPLWKNLLNKAADFDVLYLGLLAYAAIGGFTSPLTFLVLAFSGERASAWTERLLTRLLPRADPAPSTKAAPAADAPRGPTHWPQYHYRAKTFGILAAMAGAGVMMGLTVFGFHSLLVSMLPAVALAAIPFWFSTRIIKLVMRDTPAQEKSDPEFFAIVTGLRERINARRRAAGRKEIPMPELVEDPLPLPNAYATGRDPYHALVAVTSGIKRMTLDPENVRDGVARLIAGARPGTKAFKVFRFAIAGSIAGVTEGSSPADVQAAVLKADRVELKALGVRMLSGVLGHELSHVMDRHMLSNAIAGAVASSIAFASYGVMWAVGHARAAGSKLLDRVLGRPAPETALEAPNAGAPGDASRENRTLIADPITAGVVLKSLPALLKLFAALWVPVMVQIVQMASSRNNEGMADEDGALLSEDPQALALALGLLTTWRPREGFMLPGTTIPRVIGLSPMMTVNPLEQAHQAGALPKLDAFAEAVVGKGDDFLFELFVTHPDTAVRIEKLSDMADALRAAKPSRPAAAAPLPAPASRGFFRGSWEKLKGLYRVLPDEGRNRAFWAYTLGQALAAVGVDFYYTSLPGLVAPTKADTAKLGYNRAVNWGSQAAGSLLTGPFVDRQPVKRTLVWTYVGRAVLMAAVPVLFATGHFGFAVFCLLIGAAGFLQATAGTAASVAFNRILGDDEAYYNRANAILTIATNVAGVAGPLLAGAFIAWAGTVFAAPLMGGALAFGVYGALLLATGVGYGIFLKLPRDAAKTPAEAGGAARRSALRELITGFRLAWSDRFLRLYLGLSTLSIVSGDSLVFAAMPRYLADVLKAGPGAFGIFLAASSLGLGLASAAMTFVKDPAQAALAPVAVEFRAALAAREPDLDSVKLDRAAAAVRGSLNAVLERYKAEWRGDLGRARSADELAADVLARAAPDLARVLDVDAQQAAALLEASGAARDVRLWAARRGPGFVEAARRDAKSGMDSLQRQGRWSNLLHGASWLAYAGVFFTHALWPSVGLMLLSAVLAGPGGIVWSSLTTRVVAGSFPNDQGKVYSAMTFYMLACSVVGVLGLGWLMTAVPTTTALLFAGGILLACAVFDAILSFVVFPLKRR